MNRYATTICIALLMSVFGAKAQNASDLRINEVMVSNDSSIVDDYGNHVGWIEIFNTSYNYVDIGGLFITDDIKNPTKSMIVKGSPNTSIAPRSYFILYATGDNSIGTQHLTFNIKESRMIALFDGNGRTLIDSVSLPRLATNQVYCRETDGSETWTLDNAPTPNSSNWFRPYIGNADSFKTLDPTGIGMTIIAMIVVLSALSVLYACFKIIGKIATSPKKNFAKNEKPTDATSDEVNAAIAMTLYLHNQQQHDDESTVLTMRKVSKNYSPWNSKIYGMRKRPGGFSSY